MTTEMNQKTFINAWNTGHTGSPTSCNQDTSESLLASDKELLGSLVVRGKTSEGMTGFERFLARETKMRTENSRATGLLASLLNRI